MANVIRLSGGASVHSSASSSSPPSLFTSLAWSLNSGQPGVPPNLNFDRKICPSTSSVDSLSRIPLTSRKQLQSFKVNATVTAETNQPKWWERNAGPNMIDIHSTQEFLSALCEAGDRLVIVEFYGTWCASCKALFPKLCRTAKEHPEIIFLKVNFDENKPMCKSLNVKVLPYFHFYRGAHGQLESFSCSLAKFQKIKDAIEMHSQTHCDVGPPKGVGDLNLESVSVPIEKPAAST